MIASIPTVLGWTYQNIFSPVHVIFMELIMGPTCSIFFEKDPVEKTLMIQPPRRRETGMFSRKEFLGSVIQGLAIAVAILDLYYYFMQTGLPVDQTRSMVFTTLLISNLLLTFSNRSTTESLFYTIRYKNKLTGLIVLVSVMFLLVIHFVPPVRSLFGLGGLPAKNFLICVAVGVLGVAVVELYKFFVRSSRYAAGRRVI